MLVLIFFFYYYYFFSFLTTMGDVQRLNGRGGFLSFSFPTRSHSFVGEEKKKKKKKPLKIQSVPHESVPLRGRSKCDTVVTTLELEGGFFFLVKKKKKKPGLFIC